MGFFLRIKRARNNPFLRKFSWVISFALLFVILFSFYFNVVFTNITYALQENLLKHQESYLKAHLQEGALVYLNKGNYTLLEEFLQDQVTNNPLLGYVIISDGTRRVLASDAIDNFPELESFLDDPALWTPGTQLINVDDNFVLNSTSIIPGMRRLQFGIWSFDAAASAQGGIIPIFNRALVLIFLGMLFFSVFIESMGKPHKNSGKREGGLQKAGIPKSLKLDELEQLGDIFNDMMATLDSNWQENSRLQQQLKDREFMRSQYLKRVIAAQEDERKRMSRELHDQTSQSLTSLMLGLKAIQEAETLEDVKEYTTDYRQLIACSLEEIQNLAFELRPSALDDLGLVPALKRYVQELSRRKDIRLDFKWQDYPRTILGEAEETVVYRVVQEALTNIIKHAAAKNVQIRLKIRQGKFVVTIKDDGQGFDTQVIKDKDPHNLGIFGMKERAQLAEGSLYVNSRKGKGTLVILVLPLNKGEV